MRPGSPASSVSAHSWLGRVWGCALGLALRAHPGLSHTGHCCQHLDGGEGVVCLTHKQVSWHEGQCSPSCIPKPLCLKAAFSFSSVVGGGHLLIGLKLREAALLPCLVPVMEDEHG